MASQDKPWRPFVVLSATTSRMARRALHRVLEDSGYAVLAAESGTQALELARAATPDAVIVDASCTDMPGLEICRRLAGDPAFSATTPIFLFTAHGSSRRERVEAHASGVWELCSHPLDGAALLLKLQIFLRARQAAERLRTGSFIDDATGLYNMDGLRRRARELAAHARRQHEPLACIAIAATVGSEEAALNAATTQFVGSVCADVARRSDILGRIGRNAFGLLAPATDGHGAVRIIERLKAGLATRSLADASGSAEVGIRAAYRAANDLSVSPIGPMDMLLEARSELDDSAPPGLTGFGLDLMFGVSEAPRGEPPLA